MLNNIETNIHPFTGYLKATIQKDFTVQWDLTALIDSIIDEFQKYGSNLTPQECIIFLIAYIPHIYPNFYDEVIREAMPQGGGEFP